MLNGAIGANNNYEMSNDERFRKADALYTGPAGSNMGVGRQQLDGQLIRSQQPHQNMTNLLAR